MHPGRSQHNITCSGRPALLPRTLACSIIRTKLIYLCHTTQSPMPPDHRQFAALVSQSRKAAGLTMDQLAARVGVAKSNVHYWESGGGLRNADVLGPLAEALELSFEDLAAAAGYARGEGLPSFTPYLRAKYGALPEEALEEAEAFFGELTERYHAEGDDVEPHR